MLIDRANLYLLIVHKE